MMLMLTLIKVVISLYNVHDGDNKEHASGDDFDREAHKEHNRYCVWC